MSENPVEAFARAMEFEESVKRILRKDSRYARNAYVFAFQGLDFTMRETLGLGDGERRHVSAEEMLRGMKECAINEYGDMARHVWEDWGIYSTLDWGNIIFNLIDANLMHANQDDRIEDFAGVYDFDQAFAPLDAKS
ncbi:MAG: hypothetical protein KDB07_04845 [Planctomycetes bacterium]|nr:hypothetical protein [Planctomycetota bacterium]